MSYGPDYNLGWEPTAHGDFTVLAGKKARVSIWGDGANEQGLMLYRADHVALAVMRTSPGVDDQFGAELRSGKRLLEPGSYIFGGYCKIDSGDNLSSWRSSKIKVWEASSQKIVFGWDDVTRMGESGLPTHDGDFNDLMVAIEFV